MQTQFGSVSKIPETQKQVFGFSIFPTELRLQSKYQFFSKVQNFSYFTNFLLAISVEKLGGF